MKDNKITPSKKQIKKHKAKKRKIKKTSNIDQDINPNEITDNNQKIDKALLEDTNEFLKLEIPSNDLDENSNENNLELEKQFCDMDNELSELENKIDDNEINNPLLNDTLSSSEEITIADIPDKVNINDLTKEIKKEDKANNQKKNESKKGLKNIIITLLLVIFLVCLAFSLFKIINWFIDNQNVEDITEEVVEEVKEIPSDNAENINPPINKADDYWDYIKMDMLSVDFNELMKKNKDTVGWIKVNGTNINYPFVQANDNAYYLTHAYDGSYNDAGWIFADYRNDMSNFNQNTILYGHGRLNKSMFGSLKNILNSDWFNNKDNYIVKLSTPYENTLWQVFSVYSIKAEGYYITTDFISDDDYLQFLNTMKSRSAFKFSAEVNSYDKILTLSTCLNDNGYRVVMHAKLIKREARN